MIRDTCDTSLTFENIEELKYWLAYKIFNDCDTIDSINYRLLDIEEGIKIHWFEEVEIKEDTNNDN